MGTWSIVVPEAGHNLVTNPSLENDTTGYSPAGGGGTIARDTTDQRRGVACLKVMPAVNGSDGCYYAITLTAETTYAYSFDFKGKAGVPYRACLYDLVTLSVLGQQITLTGDDQWHRYEGVATNGTHTNVCVLVTKNGSTSTDPFYLDGMQVEQADHATTYIDGDQDGCKWLGPAHAAASERSAQYRLGGRVRDIDSLASGITVQSFSGTGMPPVVNLTQDRALLPGKTYCGTKVTERVLQLLILANGTSLENWHHLRKTLIDVVKPDAVSPQQPFLLRYSGAGPTVEIPVVYGGGLEQGEKSGFAEAIALRCIAYEDPDWNEEGEKAILVTAVSQTLNVSYIVGRIGGAWNAMGNAGTGSVNALAITPDGNTIYVGGYFLNWAGIANADSIVRYDVPSGTWSYLGTGTTGGVHALAIGPDGTLYAGGYFTTMGGVTANCIAKWNGSAWSALGSGITGGDGVLTLAMGPDGTLYAGGYFTTAGGVTVNNIARWNGSAWSALGSGAVNTVYALAVAPDGTLYAGGEYIVTNCIGKWNGSAWSALGSGMTDPPYPSASVRALGLAPDGTLYAGGDFTMAGGVAANFIAKWNGSGWSALGSGTDGPVWALAVAPDSTLYVSGPFTAAGGLALAQGVAQWKGTTWLPLDIFVPGTNVVDAFLASKTDLCLGFSTSGAANVSYPLTPTTSNLGTTSQYPILTIKRSGGTSATLQVIKNETTSKVLYFNYPLADGETVTIDLRPGKKSVTSSVSGNALSKVLGGSDLATWALLPGTNQLSLYAVTVGSPTVTASMHWRVKHWSVDGGAA